MNAAMLRPQIKRFNGTSFCSTFHFEEDAGVEA
jgi:hypothetical protein